MSTYAFPNAQPRHSHSYLLPAAATILRGIGQPSRLLDIGCGNGSLSNELAKLGWSVTGVDFSVSGIALAKQHFPQVTFHDGTVYDDLAFKFGQFPVVTSFEVVEHLYDPRKFARVLADCVEPNGTAIVSTPYHGYLKNLAIALSGRMDKHFTALMDHGHIKFWSKATLSKLLSEVGFTDIQFHLVGRIKPLAKSMIAVAHKP